MTYKLLSYQSSGGPRAGVLIGDTVYDAEILGGKSEYRTVLGILDDWTFADAMLATAKGGVPGMPLSEVQLLAPVLYPGEIWACGGNYRAHLTEVTQHQTTDPAKTGERPWFYSKSSRAAVIGHGAVHALPSYANKVDWEVELAVVMGKPARNVSAGDALDCVAGYTITNDLSARDFAVRNGFEPVSPFRYDWLSHKGFDGACPMGPWITPARYIKDPQALDLKLWVDDELMQDSNTSDMIFTVAQQIEEISARVTMYPGDIIMTGTPSGVGLSRNLFLKSGQRVRLAIEGIGELCHGFL